MNYRSDDISAIGHAGLLPVTMFDIRMWQEGVRYPAQAAMATGRNLDVLTEAERWDILIRSAPDSPHWDAPAGTKCACFCCRPNRRYK